ncbi:MAG: hypothetical protein U0Z17_08290 [Bacteroidales bacterium]
MKINGIVVGPEISRIFAEIILQNVDINVLNILEKEGRKYEVDYEARRYVDDYFIFSNDENFQANKENFSKRIELLQTLFESVKGRNQITIYNRCNSR